MSTYAPRFRAHRPHIDLRLGAIIALVAALAGSGAWVLVDRYTGGGGAAQDTTVLIDKLNTAWSAGEAASVAPLYTSGAVLVRDDGHVTVGAKAIAGLVAATAANRFHVERVAPVSVNRDFATTLMRYTSATDRGTLLAVFQVKKDRILRQWLFTFGRTAPFANAVIP